MYKVKEEDVTDFYSYNEPIYAPLDGWITQVVDVMQSDLLGRKKIIVELKPDKLRRS